MSFSKSLITESKIDMKYYFITVLALEKWSMLLKDEQKPPDIISTMAI